jgi:hypothetical protein
MANTTQWRNRIVGHTEEDPAQLLANPLNFHRHHNPMPGCKFSIGVSDGEKIVGVAMVGRPVGRRLDDGWTLEVNRVATDGTKNACSTAASGKNSRR